MASSSLLDNLNSEWMKGLSALQPKAAAPKVLVYVESEGDIAFWWDVLQDYKQFGVAFEIHTPFESDHATGKPKLLTYKEKVGSNLILCVDSDLDYLHQGATAQSSLVLENPFIFHTYTYSIENYYCFAEALHTHCVRATLNDKQVIDLEALIRLYSRSIYDVFLWLVYFQLRDPFIFTISEFKSLVSIVLESVNPMSDIDRALLDLRGRAIAKVKDFEDQYSEEMGDLAGVRERIAALGGHPENIYLFVEGHAMLDHVVLRFLEPLCNLLHREKVEAIRATARPQEMQDLLNKRKNDLLPIKNVIRTHTEFKSCFLYAKIRADLDRYFRDHGAALHQR
jgi:hypothetical protein